VRDALRSRRFQAEWIVGVYANDDVTLGANRAWNYMFAEGFQGFAGWRS
jgi:hypothetical protein